MDAKGVKNKGKTMHKKPIYSFEDRNSIGLDEVPLLSLMSIEDTTGFSEFDNKPALIIVLAKAGVTATSDVAQFISISSNWMYIYNQDIVDELDFYVKKAGDVMSGKLTINDDLEVSGRVDVGMDLLVDGNLKTGSYLVQGDYNDPLNANTGVSTHVNDGQVYITPRPNETHNVKVYIDGEEVLTEVTGVQFHDFATSTQAGLLRARRDGNTLYLWNSN